MRTVAATILAAALVVIVGKPAQAPEALPIGYKQDRIASVSDFIKERKNPRASRSFVCRDPLAKILYDAGFVGKNNRIAWSIMMRESRGQNVIPGHPYFNGNDYGIFQLNKPTWGRQDWWTDDILTKSGNAAAAYQLFTDRGFSPWGIDRNGNFDFSSYDGWSSWQKQKWIVEPYEHFYNQYISACKWGEWNEREEGS